VYSASHGLVGLPSRTIAEAPGSTPLSDASPSYRRGDRSHGRRRCKLVITVMGLDVNPGPDPARVDTQTAIAVRLADPPSMRSATSPEPIHEVAPMQ
jgi:hypothetical protein